MDSERHGIMFRCGLCHADFVALTGPHAPLPPERCCFCGSHKLLEFEEYDVVIGIHDKKRMSS